MNNVRPRLTMLTQEQIQDIHQYTLKLLANTGVRVDSPSALEMLRKKVGESMVDGARDRDTIQVARAHNPLTHIMIRVEQSDLELYDLVVTFADGTTFAPPMRLTFREGARSRQIDLPGTARVIRRVDFRYGNLPGSGRARLELLGR